MKSFSLIQSFALMLTLVFGLSTAQPTQAGVVTIFAAAENSGELPYGISTFQGIALGATLGVGGALIANFAWVPSWQIVGVCLIALDADGVSNTELEAQFKNRYSFIDDQSLISDLSSLVYKKLEANGALTQEKVIHISEQEVLSVFQPNLSVPALINDEQLAFIIQDLK